MRRVLYISKSVEPPWNDSSKNLVRTLACGLVRHNATVMTRPSAPRLAALGEQTITSLDVYSDAAGGFSPALRDNASVLAALAKRRNQDDIWHYFFAPNPKTSTVATMLRAVSPAATVQTVCSAPKESLRVGPLSFAERTVVLSHATEKRYRAAKVSGVVRIPPAIETLPLLTSSETSQIRSELHLPEERALILYAGDLEFGGGADLLLEVMESLPREVVLVMACRTKTAAAKEVAASLTARANLRTPGRVLWFGETTRILDLVGVADVVALPARSLYAKMDYPLVVLEAMSRGRPVIVTEGTPAEELATLFAGAISLPFEARPWAKSLRHLLGAKEMAASLGAEGRDVVVREFAPAKMVAAYENLYDELRRKK